MSRAAQKKRKRENKQKKQFALKEVVVKDEDHESEEEPIAESDDDIEQPQITKLPKIDESILFNKGFNHQFSLENFSGLTLQDIFNLRDVQDVTAHQRSSLILSSFLRPVVLENFYEDIWQKKVYRFRNENNERNKIGLTKLCNKKKIKKIVTENIMRIDEDVRILESNSPDPSISMDGLPESSQDFFRYFLKGKTMILLQPQKYEDSLWKLYSMLEYEFNSRVDGNLILQPENTTYFEPTYDADRFLIQLEGKSSLRYPSTPSDLSVFLSTNNDNEDTEGSVWNKIEFESNDVLYVPQGFPIEINSDSSTFSLTLLISTNRKNSVADLLQFTVPTAIGNLKPQLSFLNMSLPTDTRTFLGVAACEDDENPKRKAFCSLLQKSLDAIAKEVIDIIDPAVDQVGQIMQRLNCFDVHCRWVKPLSWSDCLFHSLRKKSYSPPTPPQMQLFTRIRNYVWYGLVLLLQW